MMGSFEKNSETKFVRGDLVQTVIRQLAEAGRSTHTQFIFQHFDIPPGLSSIVLDQAFFIVQEAADNIVKHASASHAFIQIYCRDNELIISIEDDGVGFDCLTEKGRGLQLLEGRVQALRGTVEVSSIKGLGTNIMIVVPIQINNGNGETGKS